jgi:hypothetical protein
VISFIGSAPGRRTSALFVATLLAASFGLALGPSADAAGEALPLGDADLAETRTTRTLAPGVTLTRIVRGSEPAQQEEINTTTRGPWRVHVLTIDPREAGGQVRATYGPDLAQVEKTTELVRFSEALAGVNASFFTFTANPRYPGDPVGLGLFEGRLLSEPTARGGEVDLVVDARSSRVLMGRLDWSGSIRNRQTEDRIGLEFLNHPPVVPAPCADLVDQTGCAEPGDLVRFTPEFAASTPPGPGVEVVLDRLGCVVRTATSRGTVLTAGQTSLQATGRESATLLEVTDRGCLDTDLTVTDEDGTELALRPSLFGVNGRYRLTDDGAVVVRAGSGSFFARNPRTIAGTTRAGAIVLVTIDGRQTTSVGATLDETAAVADSLHMHDAVNLDGGGSTAMSVGGELVNRPSGTSERAVGDALVYFEEAWSRGR